MGTHLGTRYDTVPIPPVPENTTWLDAGAVRIGIEYRNLDDDILDEAFAGRPDEAAIIDAARPETLVDRGWSLHVSDARTGDEHLRFDMFEDGPHYHYIVPRQYNLSIDFDPHACGDMFDWALGCVADRLPEMLRQAEAPELAAAVRAEDLVPALDEVRRIVRG